MNDLIGKDNVIFRCKALILELLAAVCLVELGHDVVLAAFDNYRIVRIIILIFDWIVENSIFSFEGMSRKTSFWNINEIIYTTIGIQCGLYGLIFIFHLEKQSILFYSRLLVCNLWILLFIPYKIWTIECIYKKNLNYLDWMNV